jgi:hypothetical protein
VKDETERIDARFLEPACGSGNFLVQILRRKLAAVELKYARSDFDRRHYALLGLICIYGIELLADNIAECRANLLEILAEYLNLDETDELYQAPFYVLSQNLVHSGVFLREITNRLTGGLADEMPNLEARVNHILTKQVNGIGITHLTSLLARRSVYCSKRANSKHSIARGFANDVGNIWFERVEHTRVSDRCSY